MQALELELVAVSTSIAAGCKPCTRFHVNESSGLGADSESILQAVRMGALVRDAALMMIWQEFDPEVQHLSGEHEQQTSRRQDLLCGLGSAVACNNVDLFKFYIERSRHFGIEDSDSMAVFGLAQRIKQKAALHTERIARQLDADPSAADAAASLCT